MKEIGEEDGFPGNNRVPYPIDLHLDNIPVLVIFFFRSSLRNFMKENYQKFSLMIVDDWK